MFGGIHEECGVFGVFSNTPHRVADSVYLGLYALQHRGQESCGIAVCDDGVFSYKKGEGLVHEVFGKKQLDDLGTGNIAIGHVRYSTTGGSNHSNIQPLVVRHVKGNLALAHNGNLVNADELRRGFEMSGAIFHGTSDTESIAYKIVYERLNSSSTEEAVEKAMRDIRGAYSCLLMTATKLIAFRDPNGFRPLSIGKGEKGWVVASETCAIESAGYEFVRDVLPGEIVTIDEEGIHSSKAHCGGKGTMCVFEYIYFARPDSVIEGASVHEARIIAGRSLAREDPVEADMVIGVPDSGIDAAIGFSQESGIPYGVGFVKNKYIGRSFIKPEQSERENTVRIKLNAIRSSIEGKRIVMIDDSIVRGTTSERIVRLLREAGAKEVHVRISSPPFKYPCYFGTDIDSQENLIACKHSVDEICKLIGADSLAYLSEKAVMELAPKACCGFCDGCFSGNYPVEVPKNTSKNKFEEKIHKNK